MSRAVLAAVTTIGAARTAARTGARHGIDAEKLLDQAFLDEAKRS